MFGDEWLSWFITESSMKVGPLMSSFTCYRWTDQFMFPYKIKIHLQEINSLCRCVEARQTPEHSLPINSGQAGSELLINMQNRWWDEKLWDGLSARFICFPGAGGETGHGGFTLNVESPRKTRNKTTPSAFCHVSLLQHGCSAVEWLLAGWRVISPSDTWKCHFLLLLQDNSQWRNVICSRGAHVTLTNTTDQLQSSSSLLLVRRVE